MNQAEIVLSESASGIEDAVKILKELIPHDSSDRVYGRAQDVLKDALGYLDDAIQSVADGIGLEV
jgi:hypothetical protein